MIMSMTTTMGMAASALATEPKQQMNGQTKANGGQDRCPPKPPLISPPCADSLQQQPLRSPCTRSRMFAGRRATTVLSAGVGTCHQIQGG